MGKKKKGQGNPNPIPNPTEVKADEEQQQPTGVPDVDVGKDSGEKENAGNGAGEKNNGGGKKIAGGGKEGGSITVVLKVEMHCEGCTKKIRQSVKGFKGVEGVAADVAGGKLTVVGAVEPLKLRDHVALKTHKKVELISPTNPPPKKVANPNAADKKASGDPKKPDEKKPEKPKEPVVTTVVLKIPLHCQGCIMRIRRTILKIKGAEHVSFEAEKDLVTVKGTMDGKKLPEVLKEKLKKGVEVIPPAQKKDAGGEKKDKNVGKAAEMEGSDGKDAVVNGKKAPPAAEVKLMEYYGGYSETVHAPQLFSDENPNACSVM